MAWTWNCWEEYVDGVNPIMIREGIFGMSLTDTLFRANGRLLECLSNATKAADALAKLGFDQPDTVFRESPSVLEEARKEVEQAVFAGEELLVYHRRLATSEDSYGFLHAKDVIEHWDRYSDTRRIWREIRQFLTDLREMLDGYHRLERADESFISFDLDLPEELMRDFHLARDLFSVGLDEVGLLLAGRGLEGILRRVAKNRKTVIESKGKPSPLCEADFADLIEAFSRVRWKVSNIPLISGETKNLLHFLRASRNSQAHPRLISKAPPTARDTAKVVATTASHIWQTVSTNRARIDPMIVQKNW